MFSSELLCRFAAEGLNFFIGDNRYSWAFLNRFVAGWEITKIQNIEQQLIRLAKSYQKIDGKIIWKPIIVCLILDCRMKK